MALGHQIAILIFVAIQGAIALQSSNDTEKFEPHHSTYASTDSLGSGTAEYAPNIQISNQLVGAAIGEDVTLVCNLKCNLNSDNYWRRDSGGLRIFFDSKYHSTFSCYLNNTAEMKLVIKNLGLDDFGSYSCVVKNSVGQANGTITLYEKPEPHSSTYPSTVDSENSIHGIVPIIGMSNQLVGAAIGADVTLVCNLLSYPKSMTYWRRDSGELKIPAKYNKNTIYNSLHIDTCIYSKLMRLIIKNLGPDDFGCYTCVAKNSLGEAEGTIRLYEIKESSSSTYPSSDVLASIKAEKTEPWFSEAVPLIIAVAGSNVELPCVVESLGIYKVAWIQMDRQNLFTVGNHTITFDKRFSLIVRRNRKWSLQIRGVQVSDSGRYLCQLNTKPEKNNVGFLQVIEVPEPSSSTYPSTEDLKSSTAKIFSKFRIPNQRVGASRGAPVTLRCNFKSRLNFITFHARDKTYISNSIYNRIILINTGINKVQIRLMIKSLSPNDFGSYTCVVKNSVGEAEGDIKLYEKFEPHFSTYASTDGSGSVTAEYAPNIQISNQLVGTAIGADVTLVCNLKSNPNSVTYWRRDSGGLRISFDFKYYSIFSDYLNNTAEMKLVIKNLGLDDFGSYSCVAKNSVGEANGTITLYEKPEPHTSIYPSTVDSESSIAGIAPIIGISNQLLGAAIGANVTLVCNLLSYPKSVTYWRRDSGELKIFFNTIYNIAVINKGMRTQLMGLIIKNLGPDDFGSYTCVAKNSLGEAEGTITLYEIAESSSSTYPSGSKAESKENHFIFKSASYDSTNIFPEYIYNWWKRALDDKQSRKRIDNLVSFVESIREPFEPNEPYKSSYVEPGLTLTLP